MSRYLYSNLIKICTGSILFVFSFPFLIYFVCLLISKKTFHVFTFSVVVFCLILWFVMVFIMALVDKKATNRIVFEKDRICYKGNRFYKNDAILRYFKFYVSVFDPLLVIPKLHIHINGLSIVCYLSRNDIRKLKKDNYDIKIV